MKKIAQPIFLVILFGSFAVSCTITRPTITQLVPDPPLFMVSFPLRYEANDGEFEIIVPTGFITDLASIPSSLWWWESPHETTLAPAILHDFLYWQQSCTKDEADAVMYLAMEELGLSWLKREAIYLGIRTPIAKAAWKTNSIARINGESRFFTEEYARFIMGSPIESDTTLVNIQKEAMAGNGMYIPTNNDPDLKAACEAALKQYAYKSNR